MKKSFSLIIVFILMFSIVAGCGSSQDTNSNGTTSKNEQTGSNKSSENSSSDTSNKKNEIATIKFATWSVSEAATKAALEEMAGMFEEENPNVNIEFVGIPFGDIKQQTFVMASSGNAPDIIQTFTAWFPTYAASDIVVPLDDLLGKEYINDLLPSYKDDYSYEGKLMGVPWAPSPYILYWNKELFEQAGLEVRPPKTYEEMIEFAREISKLKTDNGEQVYGLGEATEKLPINGMIALRNIYGFGGSVLDQNGKVNVNTPEIVETLNYYQTLTEEGLSPQGAKLKDLRNLFSIGRLGMYVDGYYGKAVFRNLSGKGEEYDKVWGSAMIPVNKTGQSVSIGEAHGLVVSADSPHKQIAADFIKFLTSEKAITLYHEQSDVLTARKSLGTHPKFQDADFDKVLIEQLNYVHALPKNNPGLEQAYLEIAEAVQKVTVARQDPEQVAAELDKKLKEILK